MCCHSFWMMVKLCIYELVQFSEEPYRMVILWALVLQVLKLSTEHLGSHLSLHRRAWDSAQVSEAHGVNLYWLREKKQPLFVRPLSSPLHPYRCILLSPNSISTRCYVPLWLVSIQICPCCSPFGARGLNHTHLSAFHCTVFAGLCEWRKWNLIFPLWPSSFYIFFRYKVSSYKIFH